MAVLGRPSYDDELGPVEAFGLDPRAAVVVAFMLAVGNPRQGIVTLPREECERTIRGTDFHAAATTSRHVLIAAARSTRCD